MPRFSTYAGFVKLEHTVFSLPLIYAGVRLGASHVAGQAGAWPPARVLLLVLIAGAAGRVMAMGLNRLIDAEIDARNPRTKMRELPRGVMTRGEAWAVVAVAGAVYAAGAAAIAPVCVRLALIPVALFAIYPYLKRVTSLAHLGLGLAWSMAPLGGWLAATGSLERIGQVGWLWLFSVLWVTGFDIIYATMDEAFDRQAGLHSLPAALGRRRALRVSQALHALAFLSLVALWRSQLGSPWSAACVGAVGACLVWEQAVAERAPELAFFQINAAIGFLVLGLVWMGV